MANELQSVFSAIAKSQTEAELRHALAETVEGHFRVQRWGIYLLDEQPEVPLNPEGIPQIIPEVCLKGNPVGQFVVERHAPAHEALILPAGDWRLLCPRDDHAHVMSGPIVCDGRLIGTLNLARDSSQSAFNANDLADLSALCLHLSAKIATLRSQPTKSFNTEDTENTSPLTPSPLTPREQEIAELVAQGLTNAEIGEKLWITQNSVKQALKRMFRKLGVSARAEMVAKLQG